MISIRTTGDGLRRVVAAGTAVIMAAGIMVALPEIASAETGHAPTIVWGACPPPPEGVIRDPSQECGTLRVPMDYDDPAGRTIEIAVSRVRTAKPETRRGILLFNPGGPGGEGLDLSIEMAAVLPQAVLDRYDLVGFDPRGVGRSTPISCGITVDLANLELVLPYPAPDGSITRNVAYARDTAAKCAARSGELLPHITTANTARDMDLIRRALGERKLSYFGVSYGTYLGAVYAELFKREADRIILDSAIDPETVWYDMWQTWNLGVATRFPDAARYAAERADKVGLGATVEAVTANYLALAKRLDQTPVNVPSLGMTLNGNLLREVTRSGLYSDGQLPELVALWGEVSGLVAGKPASATPALISTLQRLTAPDAADVPDDNDVAMLYAIVCGDARWSRSVERYQRNTAESRQRWPLTAGMPSNIWPCAFTKPPSEPTVKISDRGERNILILQNRRDPATPWETGLGLRRALGNRAAFVGVDAGGHVAYGWGSCADTASHAFMARGELPERDLYCARPENQTMLDGGWSPGSVRALTRSRFL